MATYSKLPSGTWRVQRKGRYISETFLKRDDARLGGKKIARLDRQLFINFGRRPATEGAGRRSHRVG